MAPQLWDKLEATPYGRVGKLVPRLDAPPYALVNKVLHDQFTAPTGHEGMIELLREIPRGKRCFAPKNSIEGIS